MTDHRVPRSLPAHVGVYLGLSTGAYALTLAAVTGLQAGSEAAIRAERAPTVAAIDRLGLAADTLGRRLDAAQQLYEGAATAYGEAGLEVAALEERLGTLATAVGEVSGTAASLPSGVKLPPVSRTVRSAAPPPVHATTSASGG